MKKLILIALLLMTLVSCGKKESPVAGEPHQKEIENSFNIFEDGKVLYPAIESSPYVESTKNCALQKEGEDCTSEKVPLLGMRGLELTTEYILQNTIVSHAFLAKNFKEYLDNVNNKFLKPMFSAVSGIVITDEMSSSFYYSTTGMIYLNASFLWKSQSEFKKLKFKKDGRFSRDKRKKVLMDLDFVKKNETIYRLSRKEERTASDLAASLNRLLFHELTHANDIYPSDEHSTLDKTKTYFKLRTERVEQELTVSENIGIARSQMIWRYSIFYIYGELINPDSYVLSREDFLTEFAPNNGMVFYSYASKREFLSMMMESYFMLFTEKYETCNSVSYKDEDQKYSKLFWFQKNRILQDNILAKAKESINLMLPAAMANELTALETTFKLDTINSPVRSSRELCRNN